MTTHGKKIRKIKEQIDPVRRYPVDEALDKVLAVKFAKFDETVDVAVRLGVDPKNSDQMVRGSVDLPNGTGKKVRVLAFCKGDKEAEAKAAGADIVGAEDIIEKIQKENWLDFDQAVATPDMMGLIGKVARILGPRGLMPNPKVGTVTPNIGPAIKAIKAGKVSYRVEKAAIIHAMIGKTSFGRQKLRENLHALMDSIVRAKPSTAKGRYIKSVSVSSTMGPGLKLDVNSLDATFNI